MPLCGDAQKLCRESIDGRRPLQEGSSLGGISHSRPRRHSARRRSRLAVGTDAPRPPRSHSHPRPPGGCGRPPLAHPRPWCLVRSRDVLVIVQLRCDIDWCDPTRLLFGRVHTPSSCSPNITADKDAVRSVEPEYLRRLPIPLTTVALEIRPFGTDTCHWRRPRPRWWASWRYARGRRFEGGERPTAVFVGWLPARIFGCSFRASELDGPEIP